MVSADTVVACLRHNDSMMIAVAVGFVAACLCHNDSIAIAFAVDPHC